MQPHSLGNIFGQNLGRFDKFGRDLGEIWTNLGEIWINLGKSD